MTLFKGVSEMEQQEVGQKEWLNPQEVSKEFGFSTSTMAKWRMDKINLPFSKMGKYIRYKRDDIIEFIESGKVEVV